jgi:pseudouridine synthase
MLNKPPGYITATRDDRGRKTVMDLVRDISERIYPVGRLDLDTEGLLLMTNDGVFARRISHPSSEIKKTYIAWVTGQLTPQAIEQLRRGVEIEGGVTAPALIAQIGREKGLTQFKLVIHEGKKRQIRRMFHAIGYETVYLKRTGIGSLALGDLPVGQYRFLTPVEVAALMK